MKFIAIASLAALGFVQPAAAVDFTGVVAPANWTIANTGTIGGGSPTPGTATFTTTQLTLTSGNATSPGGDAPACSGGSFQILGPCQLQVTTNLAGTFSFNWSYLTQDTAGAGGDLF